MRVPVLLVPFLVGASASAQVTRPMPAPGDTVRVWAITPPLDGAHGTVGRVDGDTVVFIMRSAVSRDGLDTPVAMPNLRRIDVLDGVARSRKRRVIGYSTGSVLGFAAGAYLTYRRTSLYCDPGAPCVYGGEPTNAIGDAMGIMIGGVAGATVGGTIGWVIGSRPVTRWRQVYP